MAKNKKQKGLANVLAWIVGIIVTLAVAFGLTSGALLIPFIPSIITVVAGWIVIIATLLGVVMALIGALK